MRIANGDPDVQNMFNELVTNDPELLQMCGTLGIEHACPRPPTQPPGITLVVKANIDEVSDQHDKDKERRGKLQESNKAKLLQKVRGKPRHPLNTHNPLSTCLHLAHTSEKIKASPLDKSIILRDVAGTILAVHIEPFMVSKEVFGKSVCFPWCTCLFSLFLFSFQTRRRALFRPHRSICR